MKVQRQVFLLPCLVSCFVCLLCFAHVLINTSGSSIIDSLWFVCVVYLSVGVVAAVGNRYVPRPLIREGKSTYTLCGQSRTRQVVSKP